MLIFNNSSTMMLIGALSHGDHAGIGDRVWKVDECGDCWAKPIPKWIIK
jgi:hypothetical protein